MRHHPSSGTSSRRPVRAGPSRLRCRYDRADQRKWSGPERSPVSGWSYRAISRLSQLVSVGQVAVYPAIAVEVSGHGSATRSVMLQVLGPDPTSASAVLVI